MILCRKTQPGELLHWQPTGTTLETHAMVFVFFTNTKSPLPKKIPFVVVSLELIPDLFGGMSLKNHFTNSLCKFFGVERRLSGQTTLTCDMFNPGVTSTWKGHPHGHEFVGGHDFPSLRYVPTFGVSQIHLAPSDDGKKNLVFLGYVLNQWQPPSLT